MIDRRTDIRGALISQFLQIVSVRAQRLWTDAHPIELLGELCDRISSTAPHSTKNLSNYFVNRRLCTLTPLLKKGPECLVKLGVGVLKSLQTHNFCRRVLFDECRPNIGMVRCIAAQSAADTMSAFLRRLQFCVQTRPRNGKVLVGICRPLDLRSAGVQLGLKILETSIKVIDAIDRGLPFGHQPRDDQADRGAKVGRHHRRTL